MARNEKVGLALVAFAIVAVVGILVWFGWGGARTADREIEIAPKLVVPDLPTPTLPDAPIPRPK